MGPSRLASPPADTESTPIDNHDENDENDEHWLDDILLDYEDPDDDTVTSDVHPVLAKRINKWLTAKPKPKELKTLYEKCPRPANIQNLRNVTVNTPLYQLMGPKLRDWDRKSK